MYNIFIYYIYIIIIIVITGQGHTGVPCEKYCYLWIVAEFIWLAVLYILLKTGDESRERGKHRRQARTQASDEKPRDREKG